MLHNPATTVDIELHYHQRSFGALQAHLIVRSGVDVSVAQGNAPLAMEHNGDQYERDIALVRGEPLCIDAGEAHMLLLYPGNAFVQINECEACTLTTVGITAIDLA